MNYLIHKAETKNSWIRADEGGYVKVLFKFKSFKFLKFKSYKICKISLNSRFSFLIVFKECDFSQHLLNIFQYVKHTFI